jgi:hypothetical protein
MLTHELAHALADQRFGLSRYLTAVTADDDQSLARTAVMEGQATWLQLESVARGSGRSLSNAKDLDSAMVEVLQLRDASVSLRHAPLYVRETMMFPYIQGFQFQAALLRDGKPAFALPFERPPLSTQQIIHPEKYLAGSKPQPVGLPEFSGSAGYSQIAQGTLGELDHRILMEPFVGEARASGTASHWQGSRYRLLRKAASNGTVLLYASTWDDTSAAQQLFDVMQRVVREKSRKVQIQVNKASLISGVADDGGFALRLTNATVTAILGSEGAPAN